MKVIIMCAGKNSRFGLTVKPKWAYSINGIPNIERTVKMVNKKGHRPTITLRDTNLKFTEGLDCDYKLGFNSIDTQRFSNAFPLNEETIFLYGDVYYTEEDFNKIFESVGCTKFYGRKGPNPLTKKPYGEFLGVHVIDFEYFMKAVETTTRLYNTKQIVRCIEAEVYRVHEKLDPKRTDIYNENFIELSDYTDDFDSKKELAKIRKLYKTNESI